MKEENSSNKIQIFAKRFLSWQLALGIVLGGVGGYAYYYFIGCNSGSCPITSNPTNTVLYGILMGSVLGFRDKNKEKAKEKEIQETDN